MIRLLATALFASVLSFYSGTTARSQVLTQPDTRPLPDLPDGFAEQPDGFGLPRSSGEQLTQPSVSRGKLGFLLTDVRFEGATVFDEAELRDHLKAFLGQPTTIEDLEVMRLALTQLYVNAGYINSGALLPRQQVENGVVLFRIIEGRLSAVRPFGEDIGGDFGFGGQLVPDYLTDRLAIPTDQPLNVEQLRERFGILLEDRMVDRLRGQLKPGEAPGEAVLDLEVEIRDPVFASVSVNNHNAVSNGAVGVNGDVTLYNLSGRGDVSSFNLAVTEGRRKGSGRVEMPFLAGKFTPFIEAQYSSSEVVETPFDELDITNEFSRIAIGAGFRVFQSTTDRVDLTFSFDRTTSETRLLDMPFPPTGVNDTVISAYALRFSQEWVRRGLDEVVALRSTFNLGLDVFDASKGVDSSVGDGDYFSWLGQAQYIRRLTDRLRVLGRVQAQLTKTSLPSFEQTGVGGVSTVRGYRANAISRDKALIFTLEAPILLTDLPFPGLTKSGGRAPVELTPFIDYGAGWDNGQSIGSRTDLLGIGLGLNWRPSDNISFDLVYGRPVIKDNDVARGSDLTDESIYFNITLFTN